MADVKINHQQPASGQTMTRQKAKAERLRVVAANRTVPTIKVYASTQDVHAVLRHPGGMKMRGNFGSATEWPLDAFTRRRLMDGTVSTSAPQERSKPDPKLGVREAAARFRPKAEDIPAVKPVSAAGRRAEEQSQEQPQPKPQSAPKQSAAPAA